MAKCFVIKERPSPGIPLRDGAIVVGEAGRGRKLVTVRPPDGAEITTNSRGEEVLVSVPGPGVVVLIRDHSGFRGSWHLAEYATARCPYEDREIEVGEECPGCGATRHRYEFSQHRLVPGRELSPNEIGKLIAQGQCAQGEAGRMGGGPEYLVRCLPGTRFSIRRSGRLYGAPAVLNVTVNEDDVLVTDAVREIDERTAAQSW
jgi:hypothetical protein